MSAVNGNNIKFIKTPSKEQFLSKPGEFSKDSLVFLQDTKEIYLDGELYSRNISLNENLLLHTDFSDSTNAYWQSLEINTASTGGNQWYVKNNALCIDLKPNTTYQSYNPINLLTLDTLKKQGIPLFYLLLNNKSFEFKFKLSGYMSVRYDEDADYSHLKGCTIEQLQTCLITLVPNSNNGLYGQDNPNNVILYMPTVKPLVSPGECIYFEAEIPSYISSISQNSNLSICNLHLIASNPDNQLSTVMFKNLKFECIQNPIIWDQNDENGFYMKSRTTIYTPNPADFNPVWEIIN